MNEDRLNSEMQSEELTENAKLHTLKSPSWWFGIVLALLMIYTLHLARSWDQAASYFPTLVAAVSLMFAVIHTAVPLFKRSRKRQALNPQPSSGENYNHEDGPEPSLRDQVVYLVWVVAFFAGSYLFGFMISVPSFLLIFMRAHGESWLMSASSAFGLLSFMYFVLLKVLHIAMPVPLMQQLLPSMF